MRGKSQAYCWLLLLLWLGCALATLAWLHQRQQGEFDPERQLQQLPQHWSHWQGMVGKVSSVQSTRAQSGKILLLITDETCDCQRTTKTQLAALMQQSEVELFELNSTELRQAGILVPAVPLLLFFDGQQLRYAGPISAGQFCGAPDNLLLPLLQQPQLLPGLWLNSEASACRCVVQQA